MGLISSSPSEEQVPTAELPRNDFAPEPEPEPELLTEQELEITTADTMPLPPEMEEPPATVESNTDEEVMESKSSPERSGTSGISRRDSGALLDLGEFEPAHAAAEEDFVLDIDFDDGAELAPVGSSRGSAVTEELSVPVSIIGKESARDVESGLGTVSERSPESLRSHTPEPLGLTTDPMAETQELVRPTVEPASQTSGDRRFTEPEIVTTEPVRMVAPGAGTGQITLEQLSPEAIDAIARRAVESLSEKVVQEIAWEVVPQLAELLIKRQLEEKNS